MEHLISVSWIVFTVLFEISHGQKLRTLCKYLVSNIEVFSRIFYAPVYVQSSQRTREMDRLDFVFQFDILFDVPREFKCGNDCHHQAHHSWKLQCWKIRSRQLLAIGLLVILGVHHFYIVRSIPMD